MNDTKPTRLSVFVHIIVQGLIPRIVGTFPESLRPKSPPPPAEAIFAETDVAIFYYVLLQEESAPRDDRAGADGFGKSGSRGRGAGERSCDAEVGNSEGQ